MASKPGEGGCRRINGKIVNKPLGQHSMWLQFETKRFTIMSIPGAMYPLPISQTGIPNIETYTGVTPPHLSFHWKISVPAEDLRTNWMRGIIQNKNRLQLDQQMEQTSKRYTYIWEDQQKGDGYPKFVCADGYTFTVLATLHIVKKMIDGIYKPGYQARQLFMVQNLAF